MNNESKTHPVLYIDRDDDFRGDPPDPTGKQSTSSEKQSQRQRRGGRRERQREKGTRVGVRSAWTGPGDGGEGGGRRVVAETESDGPNAGRGDWAGPPPVSGAH